MKKYIKYIVLLILLIAIPVLAFPPTPPATLSSLGLTNAVVYKGAIDCSGNPNYPAADAGDAYIVSVDGKIGGASGINVITGDMLLCKTDGTAAGTQAAVGANWNIIEQNIDLSNIIISGGAIDGTTIGATTPAAGTYLELNVTDALGTIGTIRAYNGILTFNKTQDLLANGIYWNRAGDTKWATGMDFESTDLFLAWSSAAAGDILRMSNMTVIGTDTYTAAGAPGLDDFTAGGTFTGTASKDYRVKIDGVGNPNTFTWSDDGGSTWDAATVPITAGAMTLNSGVTVTFAATTGHSINDYWDFTAYQAGKINIGKGGTPVNNSAAVTVRGHSATNGGAFAVVNPANGGGVGTPFLLWVGNNGNIKIGGADNPAEKLDVTGNIKITSGALLAPNGDVNNPAIRSVNYPTTGINFNGGAANRISFIASGTQIGEFTSTGFYTTGTALLQGYNVSATTTQITAGSGGTNVQAGRLNRQEYIRTYTFADFADSDTKKGIVIATLPAKTKLVGAYADTTTAYTGGTISAATLVVGVAAEDGAEIIASHDVKTAAVIKGLADADMGTSMTRAAQIQGGYLPSWTGTTAIYATINTTDGNTNALTTGSTTFYIVTEKF